MMSPRFVELDQLERYVVGTQYDGRVPFLAQVDVPLLERAPNVVYPITANAARSHVDFVLGEGRWPGISLETDEDEQGAAIDDAAADPVEALIGELTEHAKLKPVSRDALAMALTQRTAVALCSVRNGQPRVELLKPGWCTATYDESGDVASLEVSYPYVETYYDAQERRWKERCMLYRRVIDAQADTTFLPQPAPTPGNDQPLTWTPDPKATSAHNLGFCPVVWYACCKPCGVVNDVDGRAIHESLLDEIDALNLALSQRNRAALYCGDPQMWATGVDTDGSFAAQGRTAQVSTTEGSFAIGPTDQTGRVTRSRGARKKGAGAVWTSERSEAKFGMLTLPGDGLKALDDHIADLKSKISETMSHVDIDLENAKLAENVSGKALAVLFRRQTSFDDRLREDFGDGFLLPVVSMLLRICFKVRDGIYVDGVNDALPTLATFERAVAGADAPRWFVRLDLSWPPYFGNAPVDQSAVLNVVTATLDAKLCTREMAVEKLKTEGVIDYSCTTAELLEQIDDEKAEAVANAQAAMPPAAPSQPPPFAPKTDPAPPPPMNDDRSASA